MIHFEGYQEQKTIDEGHRSQYPICCDNNNKDKCISLDVNTDSKVHLRTIQLSSSTQKQKQSNWHKWTRINSYKEMFSINLFLSK